MWVRVRVRLRSRLVCGCGVRARVGTVHLQIAFAQHDLHRVVAKHCFELVLQLLGLHVAKLGVDFVILPCERRTLALHRSAVGARRVGLEDGEDHFHPDEVEVFDEHLPRGSHSTPHAWKRA